MIYTPEPHTRNGAHTSETICAGDLVRRIYDEYQHIYRVERISGSRAYIERTDCDYRTSVPLANLTRVTT